MSPIDMSREIVEILTENEYIRMKLHTCICHELTAEQIKELYKEVVYLTENEYVRKYLPACICHELTEEQIKELLDNQYQLKLKL